MPHESFPSPERQAPSEASKRDFAYFIDILSERGLDVKGEHFKGMGKYILHSSQLVEVMHQPDDGTLVDTSKDIDPLVASAEITEFLPNGSERTTHVELKKSGAMKRRIITSDTKKWIKKRIQAEGDPEAMEKLDQEFRAAQRVREKEVKLEEEFGADVPTDAEIHEVNESLRRLVEEQGKKPKGES